MFWPAFGWHGAELGCICPVSGWRDAGAWRLTRLPAWHGQALHALVASRLDFHFLSGWRGESFEDQTH